MNKNVLIEKLHIEPLTEEEKASRHILKRLAGPIATFKESTRNARHYNRDLWERAINDDIFQEKLENRCVFMELGHPENREEIDMEKVCACIPEMPHIEEDGDLIAYADVLDTPNGRILNTLIDYGFIPGISSRGTGDVIGDEVDPETFFLETFDIVAVPSVKKARLQVVESLQNNKSLKQALNESLEKAEGKDKKIMLETLNNLNIDINASDSDNNKEVLTEDVKKEEAKDNGSEVIKVLQEAVKGKSNLEKEVKLLQEKLAVSNAKVDELKEELDRSKSTTIRLSETSLKTKELTKRISELETSEGELKRMNEALKKRVSGLRESKFNESKKLREEFDRKENEKINKLQESLENQKNAYEKQISELKEELAKAKQLTESRNKTTSKEITESKKLAESYKNLAQDIAEKYISMRAKNLGVTPNEIKNRLSESYTTEDIDQVCEDLRAYSIRISKLPFNVEKGVKMKVTESQDQPIKKLGIKKDFVNDDDLVDEELINWAGLKK